MRLPHTRSPFRRSTSGLAVLLTLALTLPCYVAGVSAVPAESAEAAASAARRADHQQIHYHQWDSGRALRAGRAMGTKVARGKLWIDTPTAARRVGKHRYDVAAWQSPWVSPGFDFTELIASWSARTPGNSFIEIRFRGRTDAGKRSSWDLIARWAANDRYVKRTTFASQSDDLARMNVDTVVAPAGLAAYQVRVTIARREGTTLRPNVDAIGAVASRLPDRAPPTSRPGVASGIVLDVPQYSQIIHDGHFPQWGGGGEAWCSPTSTSMVISYYRRLPPPRAYRWVPDDHADPFVDYGARMTFDRTYDGTGNWPFNTAYAANRVGKSFVTRLRSLREAERFIKAGIPLVASISFGRGELDGAPISSTAGHLVVIVGFTRSGDVVINDPAGRDSAGVRRTYDRGQFERAWLPKSGGTVYVIHDGAHPLPKGAQTNW